MKALIVDCLLAEDDSMETIKSHTRENLIGKGYTVESILLREKNIGDCLGCFGCWVKTPGICVIDDYGRVFAEKIINSDVVIYLTPVVFGGYSSELKKALDRSISAVLPFFKKVKGEIHHKERYEKYPKVIVLGIMPEEDKEMKENFNELIKRNSLNIYQAFSGGTIQKGSLESIKAQLEEFLKALEVKVC